MMTWGISAWAQPQTIEVLDDNTLACEGKVRLKFQAGIDEGSDDYITNASLYIEDGNSGGERELLYITNFGDADTEIDMGFEDWEWSRRSTSNSNIGYIENVDQQRSGDNYFFIITINNLSRRDENDLNFRLSWTWDGDSDFENENTTKKVAKKNFIPSVVTTAFRDDCTPSEVNINVRVQTVCNSSNYKYDILIQKDDDPNFGSPTTFRNWKAYNAGSVGSSIEESLTDVVAGTGGVYYRATVDYQQLGGSGIVFQRVRSSIAGVQQFSVAPPSLSEVSNDICNEEINLKWTYNASQADKFRVYRTSPTGIGLNFDGNDDYVSVNGSGSLTYANSDFTAEAWIKLENSALDQKIVGQTNVTDGYTLGVENGQVKGEIFGIAGGTLNAIGGSIPSDTWVHVAMSYIVDAGTGYLRIFVNGELTETTTRSGVSYNTSTLTEIHIGKAPWDTALYTDGDIDKVRIWSSAEMASFDAFRTVSGTESNLVLYLDFEEGTPQEDNSAITSIQDRSSNNYTANLNNFTLTEEESNFVQALGEYQQIAELDGGTLEYTDQSDIESNQTYVYAVTAIKQCNGNTEESLYSNGLAGFSPTLPIAPSDLMVTANGDDNTIDLHWTDNAFDETSYEVRRRFGDATAIFTGEPNDTIFVDGVVTACRGYDYDVYAKNVCGLSAVPLQGSARLDPDLSAILADSTYNATKGKHSTRVELAWTPSANGQSLINRYRIYRRELNAVDSIQIDVVPGTTQFYRDETTAAGELYEYTIVGETDCDGDILFSNVAHSIGFRTATGLVSGQVTFAGNIAVPDVKILVERADGTSIGTSMLYDGVDDKIRIDTLPIDTTSFTIEMWAKRDDTNEGYLFSHGEAATINNEHLLMGFNATGNFVFDFGNNALSTSDTHNDTEWHHWAIVYDEMTNERFIYKDGELVIQDVSSAMYSGHGIAQMGADLTNTTFFKGFMDEVRVWDSPRTAEEIARDYNRILSSNENNLLASWSFDEHIGLYAYNRSEVGQQFDRYHGQIMGTNSIISNWAMDVPTGEQLSLFAITDASGNYILDNIPFSGVGQNYKIVPVLGTHEFEPSQRTLFIGDGSQIYNNIDFDDISSFPVTGTVFYENTSCPAEGIEVQIDGVTVLRNGEKVETDATGAFSVDVPIGQHRISLYKEGHTFATGRFPTNGSLFDFQEPVSGIQFIDNTQLKVIGRAVGGTREGDKVPGLARSVNNIGVTRIIYEALAGGGCHIDTVYTDVNTGEYTTNLYPLEYIVRDVRVINPMQNISTPDFFSAVPQINLIEIGALRTARDTVFVSGTTMVQQIDSIQYHYLQDFIYRKDAEIEVLDEDMMNPFIGEATYTYIDNNKNQTAYDLAALNLTYPIFSRTKEYRAHINVFEQYQNFDANAPIAEDKVPVTDGNLVINNLLAADDQQSIEIPIMDGDTVYVFNGGRPNIQVDSNNPQFSYTRTMSITLERPGQTADIRWEPNTGPTLDERLFRGYLLGFEDIIGSNFVTSGPQKVDFVIRDPFADNSTAAFTQGTSLKLEENFSLESGFSQSISADVKSGSKTTIGIGTATDIEATQTNSAGASIEFKTTASGGLSQEWSVSETISTNGSDEAVGTRSDLYVGKSFNMIFGITKELQIIPNTICALAGVECVDIAPGLPFKVGTRTGFRVSPSEQATTFIFDQNYIVSYLIPNLERIRNDYIVRNPTKYNMHLAADNANYGSNNDDPVWGMAMLDPARQGLLDSLEIAYAPNVVPEIEKAAAYINNPYKTTNQDMTGSSYTWNVTNGETYSLGNDSVRVYNQQIRLWKEAIASNERDKLQAFENPSSYLERNISINGGTSLSYESTFTGGASLGFAVEFGLSEEFKTKLEFEVGGNGVEGELANSQSMTINVEAKAEASNSTTWAYEITDDDQGDFHNMEVYESPVGWGPIFKNIAGQTSCPHEEGNKTLYASPGTQISERTLQRDKIDIEIFPTLVQNVPDGQSGVFNLQIRNTSETNDSRQYALRVDPNSNPDGLSVTMDGETLAVPNEFALQGGSALSKSIVVERGPEAYEYNDIRLLAYVPCQYQEGTSDEIDIVDTVTFSVTFLPTCTDLRLKEPDDLWVLNNSNNDSLQVTIDNYDINATGLESISLQYKPAAQSQWIELEKWYHQSQVGEDTYLPTNTSFIRYFWNMASNPDGDYQMRAVSGCELANKETEFKSGHADRINPEPFGTPTPSDGICSAGEDLSIQFNEPIDIGALTSLNFDIRGVLNGTDLRHSESLAFDGNNDYLEIADYDLSKRSFSVEFWAKRGANGAASIFSQGNNANNAISVGFNAANQFTFEVGSATVSSSAAVTDNQWHHFVATFDYENSDATLFIDGAEDGTSNSFAAEYTGSGMINVARASFGGQASFNGNIHELRLWSTSRDLIDIAPVINKTLNPTTTGLIGNWPMDEAIGNIAKDKVRSRHASVFGATWTVLPVGQAFQFNGSSDYLVTNPGVAAFNNEADITLEAWFKTSNSGTILSNSKADGVHSNPDGWAVSINAGGQVVVANDGYEVMSATNGLNDNNWHHFALVLDRDASTTFYVDGQVVGTSSSASWKGFGGPKFWIGARGWIDGSTEMRDNYFNGSLDEVRIWNTARRKEQVERDWVNRLMGDEFGLVAYYPFEAYRLDAGVNVLDETLEDQSMSSYHLLQGGTTALNYVQPTPPIKLQRPIERVNFRYTVNQDRIVLTPTDPAARLENVTLDITVRNIKDQYGNVLQSPATWIAYIDKNQVVWNRERIEMEIQESAGGTFQASIINSGGTLEQFDVLNLPPWLTASPTTGSVSPNSSVAVTFTIDEDVNIGDYEQDIFLSTSFGFNERLTLDLSVLAELPEWDVNPSDFPFSMSYVGELIIDGVISSDTDDILGVFIEGEPRGSARVMLDPVSNKYLVFLDVFSHRTFEKPLEFRIWDNSEGRVLAPISPTTQVFQVNELVGTRTNPQPFETQGGSQRTYDLPAGWSWLSFPLESPDLPNVNTILSGLNATNLDYIQSQDAFDIYLAGGSWFGSLTDIGGFNRLEGYKIYLEQAGTFSYGGTFDAPATDPIPLEEGWNWVGVIAENNVDVNTALATLNPSDGDIIKGQRSFAVYEAAYGWGGSLNVLEPTQGYMLRVANAGTLTYPNNTLISNENALKTAREIIGLQAQMDVTPSQFADNMSLIATLKPCDLVKNGTELYLAAFANGECRGVAPVQWNENKALAFLTIYGTTEETLSFQVLDANRNKLGLIEEFAFSKNQLLGMPSNPIQFTVDDACQLGDVPTEVAQFSSNVDIFPNPFDEVLNIKFKMPAEERVRVELQDITGRVVATIHEGILQEGIHQLQWEQHTKLELSSGVFLLSIQSESIHHVSKLVR